MNGKNNFFPVRFIAASFRLACHLACFSTIQVLCQYFLFFTDPIDLLYNIKLSLGFRHQISLSQLVEVWKQTFMYNIISSYEEN